MWPFAFARAKGSAGSWRNRRMRTSEAASSSPDAAWPSSAERRSSRFTRRIVYVRLPLHAGGRMTTTTVNPDTVSIDAIIKALYESISGPAGAPRQWDRDRALYAPGAILIPMRLPSVRKDGLGAAEILDFDGYV